MQRQPSPPHLFTPTAAATPIHSPTGDHDPQPQSPIHMTPHSPVPDDCGTEEPVAHDASQQTPLADDVHMDESERQSMPHSPPVIHIDDSDDDSAPAMAEASEEPMQEQMAEEQVEEPVVEEPMKEQVAEKQVKEPVVEEPMEEPTTKVPVAEELNEAKPKEYPPHTSMDDLPPEAPSTATSGH